MPDSVRPRRRRLLAVAVLALALYVVLRAAGLFGGDDDGDDTPPPARASASAPTPSASDTRPSPAAAAGPSYDPARYAAQVRTRARQAGVSAQLLMAILYNEAYKPHDPAFERAWQKYKPDAAFGIANMHRAAFDEVKQGRDFAGRSWDELPDDRDLAIEAEAWYLHDLAAQLPAGRSAAYTRDDLLALGYNTGAGNMLAFARGATPGSQARSYLDRLHANWTKAEQAVGTD
ncbi:lytic transglycosylase domain-containing protein [Streptomyces camelliae]|uniref:Lytic transglycosylase domain-containing protein n=1 Tax=Streptomyces camelliae TaxID=3004093 RepID=A0ABY7PCV7_9ACTN|nr:lytic transglycosylase domain-containing protein [Streptomyces sp. HUAS 2-6]WBO68416.1 lytic transglycosylase domain-containing protein [Streptomyces sp. HUAS 2-6]